MEKICIYRHEPFESILAFYFLALKTMTDLNSLVYPFAILNIVFL